MWLTKILIFLFLLPSRKADSNVKNVTNVNNAPSGFGMRFRLPFIDMNIQSVSNLKIIKDIAGQQVFILHGAEFYRLILERETKKIALIANLGGDWQESELLGAEIISWRHLFLLVVALEEHLEVYQFTNETITKTLSSSLDENIAPLQIDPIQQITLQGRYRKLFLCESSELSVTMIVLVNFNKLYSRLNTYEWSKTYFDPIEEKTIPPVQDIHIIGSTNKYIITSQMSKSQTKMTVTTYTILPTLKQIQVMQLLTNLVHPFTYQNRGYLLTCTTGHKTCTVFRMTEDQFQIYKKRPDNEVTFSHFEAGDHFLVGLKNERVSVYLNTRMECYGTFRTDTSNISSILTHISKEGSQFILLNYVGSNSTLLRFVEIEFEQKSLTVEDDNVDEEVGDPLKHQKHAFEKSIATLRKILLSRKYSFDEIKKIIGSESKNVIYQNPIRIYSGNIGIVKVVGSKLRSPIQIQQRLKALSNGVQRTRFSREFVENFNRTSSLNLKSLNVGNLILDGDLIPGFNLSSDGTHLKISKPITTKILETKELLTATVMASREQKKFFTRSIRSESNVSIRNLRVNRINGVLWDDFYQNVFLKSRDRSISGRLILQSTVEIDRLDSEILNEMPTKSLFNIVQPQNITSDIVISRFFASDLQVDLLNGLDFVRDIARKGVDNFIKSPVVAEDVSVTEKLILSEKDNRARHIFGTDILDFQQTYTGKVVIKGSLTLVNVFVEDQKNTRIVVDSQEISADLKNNFWMKSISQEFDHPISFIDCTISAPSLNTIYLNNHAVSDYLLTTTQESLKPSLLIFLSAQIEGSLIADEQFGTKLRQINKNALKISNQITVLGEKVFQGSISFDHGEIELLNQLPANDLITNDRNIINFTGNKTFKSIYVTKEAKISKDLDTRLINGVLPVRDLLESDNNFGTVVLSSILKTKNINFNYVNGFSSSKIFNSIRSVDNDLILHKDLFIQGTMEFGADLHVETINNLDWKNYVGSLVRVNENTVISGRKTFANKLTITTELKTPIINEYAIDDLFKNVLLKSQHQVISGNYTFDTVKVNNIDVLYINDFKTFDFIDTQSPKVILNSDIILKKLIVHGSLFGGLDLNFQSIENRIKSLLLKPWKDLYVLGSAKWPWGDDQQSLDLQYLFANAVRHLDDQVITGNVKLKKPLISTMNTKEIFPKNIDFNHIATDCLFHNSSMEEIVLATKIFTKPIQFAEVTALSHLGSKIVNRIDILLFNSSLYRLSQPSLIYGPLDFQVPPIFGHLTVQGLVNRMPTNGIFLAFTDRIWPPVRMHSLQVEQSIRLFDIDSMSLDFLLQNRVRKAGPAQEIFGHLTFEHLVLDKELYMQSINGISIDNVVQKNSVTLQEISGAKIIEGELRLIGPAMIAKLNGVDLVERYHQTLFIDKNYNFENVSITNATFKNKLLVKSSKNPIQDLIQNRTIDENFKMHKQTLKDIQMNLKTVEDAIATKALNSKRLVYLDYDFSTIIEWKLRNDSIQEEFVFDNNRYHYCDREQTIAKWSKYHNRISLSKKTTNTVTANEYGIQVTADNICKDNFRNVKSRITITESHFTKRFILDKLIHRIEIYNAMDMFVMFHAIDLFGGNNEIRFLKIDNNLKTIRDWQLLTDGVGKVSKLFKLQSDTILVVSTIIENYPSITIYNLNTDTQIFEIVQVIDGDFDIIELAQVTPNSYHLFLSCIHCQRIVIFEYDSLSSSLEECHMYHIYQIIKLKTRIDRFHLFTLSDGGIYLLVLSDQDIDFYHIYKYQYIQGWKHFTYGYFKNIQNAYPLLKNGISSVDDNLLLLCNRKCTLVKAFYQL